MINLIVLFYAIGSMVAGYKSGSMYAEGKGDNWKLVMPTPRVHLLILQHFR